VFVQFVSSDGIAGFSSYTNVDELEQLIRSLIHSGFIIESVNA
jgi:hypothetical protein